MRGDVATWFSGDWPKHANEVLRQTDRLTVWLVTALAYRCPVAGLFATIAIGVPVNFAIHTLDRTIELVADYGDTLESTLTKLYPSTGRALLFNFATMFLGFDILTVSPVPPLSQFGALVAVAVLVGILASVTVLPALLLNFRAQFLYRKRTILRDLDDAEIHERATWSP